MARSSDDIAATEHHVAVELKATVRGIVQVVVALGAQVERHGLDKRAERPANKLHLNQRPTGGSCQRLWPSPRAFFCRVFTLADRVQVNRASFENGLLRIDLVRDVPEAMKPRRIAVDPCAKPVTIEQKKAA